jgi:hypothetical protein
MILCVISGYSFRKKVTRRFEDNLATRALAGSIGFIIGVFLFKSKRHCELSKSPGMNQKIAQELFEYLKGANKKAPSLPLFYGREGANLSD